jgi:hypothetical protein
VALQRRVTRAFCAHGSRALRAAGRAPRRPATRSQQLREARGAAERAAAKAAPAGGPGCSNNVVCCRACCRHDAPGQPLLLRQAARGYAENSHDATHGGELRGERRRGRAAATGGCDLSEMAAFCAESALAKVRPSRMKADNSSLARRMDSLFGDLPPVQARAPPPQQPPPPQQAPPEAEEPAAKRARSDAPPDAGTAGTRFARPLPLAPAAGRHSHAALRGACARR